MTSQLIVFEGGDRSGKSTQARLLHDGIPNSVLMRYPDRSTSLGPLIKSFLCGEIRLCPVVSNLLLIASLWQSAHEIKKYQEEGRTVIMDRYVASCYVYSQLRGMKHEQLRALLAGLPTPDITYYLYITPQECSKRGNFGDEIYETVEYQSLVQSGFQQLSKDKSWVLLDASKPVEYIHQTIMQYVD